MKLLGDTAVGQSGAMWHVRVAALDGIFLVDLGAFIHLE